MTSVVRALRRLGAATGLALRCLGAVVGLALWSGSVAACPICLSAVAVTSADRLDNADRAVLAIPSPEGAWAVAADLKGDAPVDPDALEGVAVPVEPPGEGRGFLLIRDRLGQRWSILGTLAIDDAAFLRRFAMTPAPSAMRGAKAASAAAWQTRLSLVAPRLSDPDSFVAGFAHGVLAAAPYRSIRQLGGTFTPDELKALIGAEDDPARRAAYILLLGASGDPAQAAYVEDRLAQLRGQENAVELSALLAADLELGGSARVEFVERGYLLDRTRSVAEIEAALLALGVHGTADGSVARARIVEAYLRFIRARPPLAGFVAIDLARWGEWEATADYVALLNAGAITDPASAFAAATYVGSSPDEAARSRLAATQ